MRDDQRGRASPTPQARSGVTSRHPVRTGTEPVTARSALGLRVVLSAVFLPIFTAATAGFAVWAAHQGPGDNPGNGPLTVLAVACGVLALAAVADLLVVTARRRRSEHAGGTPRR